jgi:nitrite reductase/ring-hydroxylating ferredoxin subunit
MGFLTRTMTAVSESWHPLIAEAAFPAEGMFAAAVAGWQVLALRDETGAYRALNDRCTHQAARLSSGRVRRGAVMCPLHGARFDVDSGKCLGGAYPDLRVFPLRVVDGAIEICLPDIPPGPSELPIS